MDQPVVMTPDRTAAVTAEGPDVDAGLDPDVVLARGAATGDTDCWNTLFDRFAPWAYRFALAHLDRNHADAEDLCADIMLAAAATIGRFDPRRGPLDAWMAGLARHRLSRFCRRRRRHLPLVIDPGDDAPDIPAADPADEALTRITVQRALACLPERQSTALISKYVDGRTTEEIARITQVTPAAVESLLGRARVAFRSAFAALCGDLPGGHSHE